MMHIVIIYMISKIIFPDNGKLSITLIVSKKIIIRNTFIFTNDKKTMQF